MNNYYIFIIQKSILNKNIAMINKKYYENYKKNFHFYNILLLNKMQKIFDKLTYNEYFNNQDKYYEIITKKKEKEKILKQKFALNLDILNDISFKKSYYEKFKRLYKKIDFKYQKYFRYNIDGHLLFNKELKEEYVFDQDFLQEIINIDVGLDLVIKVPEYFNKFNDLLYYVSNGRLWDFEY